MSQGATLVVADDDSVCVNVPMKLKRRGGRKEIILPSETEAPEHSLPAHRNALVLALARAHQWQELLDAGRFASISDLAREIGLDPSFAARLLRLTLLAPDIVEGILIGEEPDGLTLTTLTKRLPMVWDEQWRWLLPSE